MAKALTIPHRTNFYEAVVREHRVHIPIPPGETQNSQMMLLESKIHKRLCCKCGGVLAKGDGDSPFIRTLNAPVRSFRGLHSADATVVRTLARIRSIRNRHEIPDVLHELHLRGCKVLFYPMYDPDLRTPERNMIYLHATQPVLAEMRGRRKHVTETYESFGIPSPDTDLKRTEARLCEHLPSRYDLQSPVKCFNPITDHQMNRDLTWLKFYCLPHVNQKHVSVDSIEYFASLGQLMEVLPLQAWIDFLEFNWLHSVSNLFSDMSDQCGYDSACTAWWQDASEQFILAERKQLEHIRPVAVTMFEDMRDTLREIFKVTNWSQQTRLEAIAKLDAMTAVIGWPEGVPIVLKKPPNLPEGMPFDECVFAGHAYQYGLIWDNNGTPSDPRQWRWESCTTVNAFYSREANVVYIPPSLFYSPFLHGEPEKLVDNYAAFGSILAHEIYHGFDYDSRYEAVQCLTVRYCTAKHRYIDSFGKLRNWWTPRDEANYMNNVRKTIDLYASRQSKRDASSRMTLSENIADIVALRLAWQTLQMRFVVQNGRAMGQDESRRFFEVFATSQVQVHTDEAKQESSRTDLHASAEIRVNTPLSAFAPFLELYQVRRNDPMYTDVDSRPDFLPAR